MKVVFTATFPDEKLDEMLAKEGATREEFIRQFRSMESEFKQEAVEIPGTEISLEVIP